MTNISRVRVLSGSRTYQSIATVSVFNFSSLCCHRWFYFLNHLRRLKSQSNKSNYFQTRSNAATARCRDLLCSLSSILRPSLWTFIRNFNREHRNYKSTFIYMRPCINWDRSLSAKWLATNMTTVGRIPSEATFHSFRPTLPAGTTSNLANRYRQGTLLQESYI